MKRSEGQREAGMEVLREERCWGYIRRPAEPNATSRARSFLEY